MKTTTKYILASSLVAIIIVAMFGGYFLSQYQDYEVREEQEKLETSIRTFWELLNHKGTDFRVVNGQLLAGAYAVNGNFELPDKVQDIFGGVATVFMGDERVSTNVLNAEGKRALGTRLVGPAYDAIFKQGRTYRGVVNILDVPYLTAYDPIKNRQGEVIGALFVGIKESELLERMHDLNVHLMMTLAGMATFFIFLMVVLGRALHQVEAANDSQIRFQQTLLNTIPNPVFYKDTDCRYLGCNKAFEFYAGISQDELVGKTPHDLWPEELAECYLQQDLALLETPGFQGYEASVRYADGRLRDVIFNKATFSDSNGAVAGLVGVILDITERKAAEEATKNAYQQLWEIVEFLPDATFVVDKEKRVIAWNRAIEKMTGLKKEDVIGKGDYVYSIPFYGERRPILIDLIDENMDLIRDKYAFITIEGRTLFAEAIIPNFRGGADCCLWGTATPLFDSQGNQVGGIQSIRDITGYKQAEGERLLLKSQVDQNRLMETIMVRLGHDLKTPLTPLFILLPLIRKQLAQPDLIKKFDICIKSAKSIKNLADKAAVLAKLSFRIQPFDAEDLCLAAVVDDSVLTCEDMLGLKQIVCQNCVDPAVIVHGMPGQLRELFVNLISNAVHFSNDRSVITISAEQHGNALWISVRDEGVGIAADHLEHVFDELFKADESRHDLETSGLGLSICKRIVLNHHGRIWAESPGIGQGTIMRFTLPRKAV